MLNIVKKALRIAGDTFDDEITLLISACIAEMTAMNVTNISETIEGVTTYDPQAQQAIIAYCKWKFGNNEDKAEWAEIYHMSLAQLKTMNGHTEWAVGSNG